MSERSPDTLRRLRLASLALAGPAPTDLGGLVRWFGAMQAQDLASIKWSLGLRLGLTAAQIDAQLAEAFARGEVVRTWPMRGTLHLVPGDDARSMLAIAGRRVERTMAKRWADLGLDARTRARALEVLAEACANRRPTRPALLGALEAASIATTGQRGYHLLVAAALAGVLCLGPDADGEQTFARLDDVVKSPPSLSPDEAAARLATRYFQSHGPATAKDLARWTGWNLGEARRAIATAGASLAAVAHGGVEHWLSPEILARGPAPAASALALPGFDELVLGYENRALHLGEGALARIVPGGNGVFRATLVHDGRVVGTWSRTIRERAVLVEAEPFEPLAAAWKKRLADALEGYGRYLARPVTLTWKA